MTQTIAEQRVTGNPGGGPLPSFWPMPIPVGLAVQQAAMMHGSQPVSTVNVTSMQFAITDTATPPGGVSTFAFVSTLVIYVVSTRANSSLPKLQIASLATPPGSAMDMSLLTVSTPNLLPYILEGSQLTAEATGTSPSHDTTYVGGLTVHVKTL